MKLSCTPISLAGDIRQSTLDLHGFITFCADVGFDGVDLLDTRGYPWLWGESRPDFATVIGWINDAGLSLAAYGCGNNFAKQDPGERAGVIEGVKVAIRQAAELGAPVLRIFGGHLGRGHGDVGIEPANGTAMVLAGIEACLPVAEEHGIVLGLENHGALPGHGFELLALIEAFDSPWLKCTFDCGNFIANNMLEREDPIRALEMLKGHLGHVHVKDFEWKDVPEKGRRAVARVAGDGEVPLRQLTAMLIKSGYSGFYTLEYEASGLPEQEGVRRSYEYLDGLRKLHQSLGLLTPEPTPAPSAERPAPAPDRDARPMRIMSIMAHQDDFEFNAGGTFASMRQAYGDDVELLILATTRGASGHQDMSLEETFRRRDAEARASAAVIGAGYACLTCLDGSHVPGQLLPDRNVLGGLWNAIRRFEPDVIFCPPVASDPLAGIHIDHDGTAHAVRMVAYQLIVPHAYPTLDGPVKRRFRSPLIINVDDGYSAEAQFHIRHDISDTYDTKVEMALCHESQILEWLPFTRGEVGPLTRERWLDQFGKRHLRLNRRYRQPDQVPSEYFRVTRWGRKPDEGELARLFPAAMGRVNQAAPVASQSL